MNPDQVERLASLTDQEIGDAVDVAVAYALNRMAIYPWRGVAAGESLAKDFVQEALEDIFEGRRNWNFDKYPTLGEILCSVVSSKVNHLAKSWENRTHRFGSDLDPQGSDGPVGFDKFASSVDTPDKKLLRREEEEFSERFLLGLLDHLEGSPDLQKLVELIWDGTTKRAKLAEDLGVTPDDVTKMKRRLERKMIDFCDKNPELLGSYSTYEGQ